MVEKNQNAEFYLNNRHDLVFTIPNIDLTSGHTLQWALANVSEEGNVAVSSPILKKTSASALEITVSYSSPDSTVTVIVQEDDTVNFSPGTYRQQLEDVDSNSDPVMLAEGDVTLLPNIDDTA